MLFEKLFQCSVLVELVFRHNNDLLSLLGDLYRRFGEHLLLIDWCGARFDKDRRRGTSVVVPVNLKKSFEFILVTQVFWTELVWHHSDLAKLCHDYNGEMVVTTKFLNCNRFALVVIHTSMRCSELDSFNADLARKNHDDWAILVIVTSIAAVWASHMTSSIYTCRCCSLSSKTPHSETSATRKTTSMWLLE